MSRPDTNSRGLYNRAIESGLFDSGRPILLSPPSPPRQIATNVLIAWNCSTEQARATALAMPLLQKADRVTVLTVAGGTEVPGPSAEQLIRYLQRNGIAAEPLTVELNGRNSGEAILATAQSLGCDLLIKGAYTHSRLRQIIFGGATQHVLANATCPSCWRIGPAHNARSSTDRERHRSGVRLGCLSPHHGRWLACGQISPFITVRVARGGW